MSEIEQGQYPLLGHIKPDFIAILDWLEMGGTAGGCTWKPPTLLLFNSVLSPRFQPLSITNRGWNVLDKCMPYTLQSELYMLILCFFSLVFIFSFYLKFSYFLIFYKTDKSKTRQKLHIYIHFNIYFFFYFC